MTELQHSERRSDGEVGAMVMTPEHNGVKEWVATASSPAGAIAKANGCSMTGVTMRSKWEVFSPVFFGSILLESFVRTSVLTSKRDFLRMCVDVSVDASTLGRASKE